MFKRTALAFGLILATVGVSYAAKPLVAEAPFDVCADPFSVSIATYQWTAIPASNCAGRAGVFLNALSGNTGTIRVVATNSSTAPTISTSTYAVWEITPSANASFIGARDATYLWGVTTHTAAETASGVEVEQ